MKEYRNTELELLNKKEPDYIIDCPKCRKVCGLTHDELTPYCKFCGFDLIKNAEIKKKVR